jgi:hypothetical protein
MHTRYYSDKCFEWRPGQLYIPVMSFTGLTTIAINEGGAGNYAAGATFAGTGAGAPITKEISTFGMNGVLMDTDGDVLDHYLRLPWDVDLKRDIKFRVHWTSGSATTADTIDWKVFYLGLVPNSTTIAAATTALDTVIAQDTVVGAYADQVTEWGILKGDTLGQNVEALTIQVEMDTFAVGLTEDKFLLGLEMAYTPKRMRGPDGMAHPATYPTTALGSLYA